MTNYSAAITGNIRAERARRGIDQREVEAGMRARGFPGWGRGITGKIERGERRVLAEELSGLADVLGCPVEKLLSLE